MATKLNTQLANLMAQAMGDAFGGGTLEIYTGSQPGSANNSATGTKLAEISLPNPCFGSASSAKVTKDGTWETTATESGEAGYFRMKSDDGSKIKDGNITEDGGGGELIIDNKMIESGGTVTVVSAEITQPLS